MIAIALVKLVSAFYFYLSALVVYALANGTEAMMKVAG